MWLYLKNAEEFECLLRHFKTYEQASGAKLNQDKTEKIWMGDTEHKLKF